MLNLESIIIAIIMWSFFSRDAAKDFAYELGSEIEGLKDYSIWRLHHGKKKVSEYDV